MKKQYYLINLKTGRTVAGSNSLEVILKKYKKNNIENGVVYVTTRDAYLPAEKLEEYLEKHEEVDEC